MTDQLYRLQRMIYMFLMMEHKLDRLCYSAALSNLLCCMKWDDDVCT